MNPKCGTDLGNVGESRCNRNEIIRPPRLTVVAKPTEYWEHSRAPAVDVLRVRHQPARSFGRDTKEARVVHLDAHSPRFRFGPNNFAHASLIRVVQALWDQHRSPLRASERTEDP